MNKLTRYILKKICKLVVRQGHHKAQIQEYYQLLYEAAFKEFTEDNKPTLDSFLADIHKEAMNEPKKISCNNCYGSGKLWA